LVGVLHVIDIFGRTEFHVSKGWQSSLATTEIVDVDLHAAGMSSREAQLSWARVLARFPFALPLIPFLFIPAIAGTIYQSHGQPPAHELSESLPLAERRDVHSIWAVIVTSTLFLAGTVYTGSVAMKDCWPVCCFPTFIRESPLRERLTVDLLSKDKVRHFTVSGSLPYLPGDVTFLKQLENAPSDGAKQNKLAAIWQLVSAHDPSLRSASKVSFWQENYDVVPNLGIGNAIERRFLGEIDVGEHGSLR
jgi:hypothetical protein